MEMAYTTPDDYEDYPVITNRSTSTVCNTIDINDFCKNFLPRFYYVIFIASVLGNGVVLLVLYKFEKLNTVTNIFLMNLVASNIVVTLTLPFHAIHYSNQWIFGEALCKLVNSTDYLGFYSSILFLTLMTFDRYLAVVHCVVANKQRRTCYAVVLSAVVWIISLLASLEPYIHFTVEEYPIEGLVCEDTSNFQWKLFSLYKQFVLFFILPLTVFIYCYFRITLTVLATRMVGKHRTVRLIFVIVLMFFAFWSPHNIILMINGHGDPKQCSSLSYAEYVTSNMARLYFCINPVFYTFLGRKFQNHVRGVLVSQVPCLSDRISFSSSSRMLA
ncbi:C-C chemokine receptor type 3-like protein [Labeo rohita]|uniref:C-C chemokine receptor type 3-like protein n=2 Tax=Labeo rohita TaxID=84645 RepID=A0A498LCT5_LABRO|nr:C-C chemokine receptor type 3 [Labeo rohita]KAI2649331.1 C-C chemokine receptor type 5 [Labeo rohita]RXN04324.1 C-C chemokine receptor type 3-like protein [Labeo rohita]